MPRRREVTAEVRVGPVEMGLLHPPGPAVGVGRVAREEERPRARVVVTVDGTALTCSARTTC